MGLGAYPDFPPISLTLSLNLLNLLPSKNLLSALLLAVNPLVCTFVSWLLSFVVSITEAEREALLVLAIASLDSLMRFGLIAGVVFSLFSKPDRLGMTSEERDAPLCYSRS